MRGFTVSSFTVSSFTVSSVILSCMLLLSACAEPQQGIGRPQFGDGGTLGGQNATVQSGSGLVACTAVPESSTVSAGERFLVKVTLTAGAMPFSIVGFFDNLITSSADVWGTVNTTGTVNRRINVRAANGTASCRFTVTAN